MGSFGGLRFGRYVTLGGKRQVEERGQQEKEKKTRKRR
jgi:hypothetical protein